MAAPKIKTTEKVRPQCYAYTTPGVTNNEGWTKIGYTERDVETRINEQTHTAGVEHITHWHLDALYKSEPCIPFTDHDFHPYLRKFCERRTKSEWFNIDPKKALKHFNEFTKNHGVVSKNEAEAAAPYELREEQKDAVKKTADYFRGRESTEFLWNAKPRFGKTLAAYSLCKELDAKKVLIVTNRPAIAHSWYSDYEKYLGLDSNYVFVSRVDGIKGKLVYSSDEYNNVKLKENPNYKCIEFVSLQDLKGSVYFGGSIGKLKELNETKWDILIVDEAHEGVDTYKTDTAFDHIKRKWTLHLSGTPFKALANDKFPEEAIFNWTYADEQKKKRDWDPTSEFENPYADFPRISLFIYKMSDIVCEKVQEGMKVSDNDVQYAFDLNEFFKVNSKGIFIHDKEVDKFLEALTTQERFPFSTHELREELKHTLWLLDRVDSAKALKKKMDTHAVFENYEIILAAGDGKTYDDDENQKSYDKVVKAIKEHDKTITLSVGQLTTGVTIPEWTGVLMLSNIEKASPYMQTAFRTQTPCLFQVRHGKKSDFYRKEDVYVFDFAPVRSLKIYTQIANELNPTTSNVNHDNDTDNVRELLNFFPIYAEDDNGSMEEVDAEQVFSIPRRIHAKENVNRGFQSRFMFNLNAFANAPKELVDTLNNMPADKPIKPEKDNGKLEVKHISSKENLFGEKLYKELDEVTNKNQQTIISTSDDQETILKTLREEYSKPFAKFWMDTVKKTYGNKLNKTVLERLDSDFRKIAEEIIEHEFGDYVTCKAELDKECENKLQEKKNSGAASDVVEQIKNEYETKCRQRYIDMIKLINEKLRADAMTKAEEKVADVVEAEIKAEQKTKDDILIDHLRGFSRAFPALLMAYGDENTTLDNFNEKVPPEAFREATTNPKNGNGMTLSEFCKLRDGCDYVENGEQKHFEGHMFDKEVFNESVKEFMSRKKSFANYLDSDQTETIFDYIPPLKANQIFTPKKVVVDMVDKLEKENPGCFDDPDATFADLYMKSGMYITEIVKRLYRSERMKQLFPDDAQRLNHIFAKQVYGCAPTQLLYDISRSYIFGFNNDIHIEKDNIRLFDTMESAKNKTMEEDVRSLFNL